MSFRLKTILGIAGIEIVLLAILIVSGLRYMQTANEEQLITRAQTSVQMFASMTTEAVAATDLATLDVLVGQVMQNSGIVYARVRDLSGRDLAHDGFSRILNEPFIADSSLDTTFNDNRFDIAHPIEIAGTKFGNVELGIDTLSLRKNLRNATQWMLTVAAIGILFVVLFGYLFGRILTKQLDSLKVGAQLVADGDFDYQIPVHGRDELADTAISFNLMAEKLSRYSQEVEQKVSERTGKLRKEIAERIHAEESLRLTLRDLKDTQDSLIESEKMASLGGLVAGVAHEINTPIGIGVTAASHLRDIAIESKNLYETNNLKRSSLEKLIGTVDQSTEMIFSNLNRASDLIRSFKQVTVDQTSEARRCVMLATYAEELLMSLQPQLKQTKHQVAVECDPALSIESYPGAIAQTLTNLIMNSVKHAYRKADQGQIRIKFEDQENHVALIYSDDGRGMDEATQSKIFEPFFTTKRGEGGTGLGMHIVYNLISQKLKGRIDCEREIGQGTIFTITIPKNEEIKNVKSM